MNAGERSASSLRPPGEYWKAYAPCSESRSLNAPPVLLCSSPGRFYLRRLLEPFLPKIVVLAPTEIPPMTPVRIVSGVVR